MEPLPKVLESQVIVRFQDCDPYQHLNNSKYLDYMLNAREDQIALHYGLDIFKMAKEKKIAWVVGQHQITYLRPAFFMETVTVQSQLIGIADRSVQVEMRMYNEDKTVLYSVLWSTFVHVNLVTQSAEKHSQELMELFHQVHFPVIEESFDGRILFFRRMGK